MARLDKSKQPPPYPAEKARGGEIILRTPLRQAIFVGRLAGIIVLIVILQIVYWTGA